MLRAIPVKPNGASERRYTSCSTPLGVGTFSTKRLKVTSSILVAVTGCGETWLIRGESLFPALQPTEQDKLVLTMAEESGGIWVLDNVDR